MAHVVAVVFEEAADLDKFLAAAKRAANGERTGLLMSALIDSVKTSTDIRTTEYDGRPVRARKRPTLPSKGYGSTHNAVVLRGEIVHQGRSQNEARRIYVDHKYRLKTDATAQPGTVRLVRDGRILAEFPPDPNRPIR